MDAGTAIATDPLGSIYVAVTFQGTVDFDPGPGDMTRFSVGDSTDPEAVDVAVIKFSSDLEPQWVITFGSPGADRVNALRLAPNGDVVIAGYIGGMVYDVDPSDTVTALAGHLGRDAFVIRYSSDGRLRWAHSFGDAEANASDVNAYDEAIDCIVDEQNAVLVTGTYNGSIDLDPATDSTSTMFTSNKASKDIWFASYAIDGTCLWAHGIGGTGKDEGHAIRSYKGNIIVAGCFSDALDADLSDSVRELTSNGVTDAFVLWYTAQRKLNWCTSFGGPQYNDQVRPGAMHVSSNGDVSITGDFGGTVDLDRGPAVTRLVSKGQGDVFYVCYAMDSTIQRSFSVGGAGTDVGMCLAVDPMGTLTIGGSFQTVADFDPGSGVLSLQAGGINGATNAFIANYTRDGAVRWGTAMGADVNGATNITTGNGIALDAINGMWLIGQFVDAIDIDPAASKFYLRSAGMSDGFITHYEPNGDLNIGNMTSVMSASPSATGSIHDLIRNGAAYTVYTLDGRTIDATLQELQRGIYVIVMIGPAPTSTLIFVP